MTANTKHRYLLSYIDPTTVQKYNYAKFVSSKRPITVREEEAEQEHPNPITDQSFDEILSDIAQ